MNSKFVLNFLAIAGLTFTISGTAQDTIESSNKDLIEKLTVIESIDIASEMEIDESKLEPDDPEVKAILEEVEIMKTEDEESAAGSAKEIVIQKRSVVTSKTDDSLANSILVSQELKQVEVLEFAAAQEIKKNAEILRLKQRELEEHADHGHDHGHDHDKEHDEDHSDHEDDEDH